MMKPRFLIIILHVQKRGMYINVSNQIITIRTLLDVPTKRFSDRPDSIKTSLISKSTTQSPSKTAKVVFKLIVLVTNRNIYILIKTLKTFLYNSFSHIRRNSNSSMGSAFNLKSEGHRFESYYN